MKRLAIRVPDDLHERLVRRARAEGLSVSAFVSETLQRASPRPSGPRPAGPDGSDEDGVEDRSQR